MDENEGSDDDDDNSERPSKPGPKESGLKESAAGLCIGMGSFSDPEELPGLAHFLEHMVFMGSTKYPSENAFDKFIQKHGGFDNAHTDCENTTFYFEVQRKYLSSALDMFAQFFIQPLMSQNAMEREREAVDSEFQMALTSDYNRKYQIFTSLAKKSHPMAKFMWGNSESLKLGGVSRLGTFYFIITQP
jgi:nardilysin